MVNANEQPSGHSKKVSARAGTGVTAEGQVLGYIAVVLATDAALANAYALCKSRNAGQNGSVPDVGNAHLPRGLIRWLLLPFTWIGNMEDRDRTVDEVSAGLVACVALATAIFLGVTLRTGKLVEPCLY